MCAVGLEFMQVIRT